MWKKSIVRTKTQYVLYLIMFVYSVSNVLAALVISNKENPVILMILIESIMFAIMYLLYAMKVSDEFYEANRHNYFVWKFD